MESCIVLICLIQQKIMGICRYSCTKIFTKKWILIRKPDRPGIIDAIKESGGNIDLCHYDSDKSWYGRQYAYPILWESLKSKGIFISDDIQDNLFFYEFVNNKLLNFSVVEFEGKFVGLIAKP